MPHVPLFASQAFEGKSPRGLFGDVVEELDWSVGQVLDALRKAGLDKQTLVVFSSDNGPWLIFDHHGGSAGPLRDGKGSTYEGGMRVPGIFWWPGKISAGVVTPELGSTMDVFTTTIKFCGGTVPTDRAIDGIDLAPVLTGQGPSPRQSFFFYRGSQLYAARKGLLKAHFITRSGYGPDAEEKHESPLLYHLGEDPGERFNVAEKYPQVIQKIQQEVSEHQKTMTPGENQLAKIAAKRN